MRPARACTGCVAPEMAGGDHHSTAVMNRHAIHLNLQLRAHRSNAVALQQHVARPGRRTASVNNQTAFEQFGLGHDSAHSSRAWWRVSIPLVVNVW